MSKVTPFLMFNDQLEAAMAFYTSAFPQIVPRRLVELIGDEDPEKVRRVMAAMMTMVKLDVAALERAYDGA